MTNIERMPKSEVQMEPLQVLSRRFGFRDSGFFRHWSFVIRISLRRVAIIQAREFPHQNVMFMELAKIPSKKKKGPENRSPHAGTDSINEEAYCFAR